MARVLVQKKIAKAIRLVQGSSPDDDDLPAGYMRLYGFYKPSLEAGLYGIEAKQVVNAEGNDTLDIFNYKGPKSTPPPSTVEQQLFSVAAPQFSIDPKLINTFYPPSGHQDEGRILPHIVFSDPHVPWLRLAGISYPWLSGPIDPDTTTSSIGRNMVPWMALMVFDSDELTVLPADATSIGLANIASYIPSKLPGNGAFPMMVGEYLSKITRNRIYYEAAYTEPAAQNDFNALKSSTEVTSIIFPTKTRLQEILGGKDQPNALQGQKLLAHVRHVNTTGFPDAGIEEDGYYSVVVSSMTGRIDNTTPVTQVVHLVSIENYDSTVTNSNSPFATLGDTERVGLVSLFSWNYTAIPEASNFVQTIQNLASNMQYLKPPQPVLDSLQNSASGQATGPMKVATQLLHDRLSNSYTLSRWRTSTGEQTVAFNRGPLVSTSTSDVPTNKVSSWPALSMSGKDYQIFDEDVGLMDVTYSSAWSLGRLVAISDSPFNAALLRFRSLIWQQAASNTRLTVNQIPSAQLIMKGLSPSIISAGAITSDSFSGTVRRLNPASTSSVAPPISSPAVAPIFSKAIKQAVATNASMSNSDGQEIYSDFQLGSAANSDWELIHNWISNCLYLANIPAHYLFPEPSHIKGQPVSAASSSVTSLPPEALRFFYIDNAWLDCFIDGALSCANHLEPEYDHTRQRIKEVYNYYLSSNIYPLEGQTPPIPRSGFVLRSSVVKAIPDLKITVSARKWDSGSQWIVDPDNDPVVRITRMDDFTILCLLDCLPQGIFQVTIAQPPHQQRFALGSSLELIDNEAIPNVEVKMLYTSVGAPEVWQPLSSQPKDQQTYYNPGTRCIAPMTMANSINSSLLAANPVGSPALYDDKIPDSCVLGLELNDPSYQLSISTPVPSEKGPLPTWVRQLWIGSENLDSVSSTKIKAVTPQSASHIQLHSQVLPTVSTKRQLLVPVVHPLPPPRLFFSTVVPSASPILSRTATSKATSTASASIDGAQFTVVLHPDYRPAPPTPYQSSASNVYAPLDFLPTGANTLYDVIVVVRRIKPATSPGYKLVELDVELPISDGTDAPDSHGNIREPLIPAGGYTGGGVRMTTNHRFVPTLYTAADSNKKTVLGVKLIPRSGDPSATITLTNDGRTTDASVRLAECPIAPIVDSSKGVQVATVDANGIGTGKSARQPRGICKIVLKEVYLMDDGSEKTITTDGSVIAAGVPLWVLKRAGGDVDLNGNAV